MNATWVDSHAHYYQCFSLDRFLNAARKNFMRGGLTDEVGVLLMVHVEADEHPLALIQQRMNQGNHAWTYRMAESADGIICHFHDQPSLVLIAGRQIVTSERLELLALCTAERIAPGQPLEVSIGRTREANGIPVLPWGFGKWWFRRGRILQNLLRSRDAQIRVFLGDNGGRSSLFGIPRQLQLGRQQGFVVLAGSDPLNLPRAEGRVCSYGSVLDGKIDLDQPVQWMRDQLLRINESPPHFGSCRSAHGFLIDQIRLRMNSK